LYHKAHPLLSSISVFPICLHFQDLPSTLWLVVKHLQKL
jgi:hypothetical protein